MIACCLKRSTLSYLAEKWPIIKFPTLANRAIFAAWVGVECLVLVALDFNSSKNVDSW